MEKSLKVSKKLFAVVCVVLLVILTIPVYLFLNRSSCPNFTKYKPTSLPLEISKISTPGGIWEYGLIQPIVESVGTENGKSFFTGVVQTSSSCKAVKVYYGGDFETDDRSGLLEDYTKVYLNNEVIAVSDLGESISKGKQIGAFVLFKQPEDEALTDELCKDNPIHCTMQNVQNELEPDFASNDSIFSTDQKSINLFSVNFVSELKELTKNE